MADLETIVSDKIGFDKHVEALTESQKSFVDLLRDWFRRPRNAVVLISGGPGSGKTYTVIETLNLLGVRSVRMAPTAFLASKIRGETIHSTLQLNWVRGSLLNRVTALLEEEECVETCLEASRDLTKEMFFHSDENIVVLDEVGMVPFWLTYWIIRFFFDAKRDTLFIAMGDARQLKPVRAQYNIFNVDFDQEFEMHRLSLLENKRFSPEYLPVVEKLSQLVDEKNLTRLFEYVATHYPVVESIDVNHLKECKRALVYRNATATLYNRFYMSRLPGKPYRLYKIDEKKRVNRNYYVDVKPGCDVVVTENNAAMERDVINGTVLRFQRYDAKKDAAICTDVSGRSILIKRVKGVIPIIPNFAGTIHKFQGMTIDLNNIIFNFNGSIDLHLIYTALSRVRSMGQILAVQL